MVGKKASSRKSRIVEHALSEAFFYRLKNGCTEGLGSEIFAQLVGLT